MKASTFYKHILIFCLYLAINGVRSVCAQVAYAPSLLPDDPIVAALDSLYKLDLFERGYAKVHYSINPKYNFAPDSIPRYDDMVYESRLAKLDAASPFDLEYNQYVQNYIDMYTNRRREQVARTMALTQLYFPMFEQVLDKYNLPLELKYLAICESALNPLARSKSGAMGLWQFMYPTGKMFGLNVTSYIDERCDPYKSTVAACEYFKYLYSMFGDWQMVLAAYNCGPGNLNKAIRRSGGKKTYWEVRPFLPTETQGYVPAFIAVNYVMNFTSEHNIRMAIPKKTFLEVDTIAVKQQLSFSQVAAFLDIPLDELNYMNPSYKRSVIPIVPGQISYITLPANKVAAFINNEANIYNFHNNDNTSSQDIIATQEKTQTHVVKKGEYLSSIARKYGCTVTELKAWNGITANSVKPGKKLIIHTQEKNTNPASVVTPEKVTTVASSTVTTSSVLKEEKKVNTVGTKYYVIKKGDSLYRIAQANNTTVDELKRLNNLGVNYNLLPGKKLKVSE
ncbi:MAG: LysM peptidoglycan-binding domain-containing protein [Bacteroidia bacterium]